MEYVLDQRRLHGDVHCGFARLSQGLRVSSTGKFANSEEEAQVIMNCAVLEIRVHIIP